MKLGIYEVNEGRQKIAAYREIKQHDCFYTNNSPMGMALVVFDCPEVKDLVGEYNYKFLPSATSPTTTTPARLLMNIDVPGRKTIKLAFPWRVIPNILLDANYLLLLAAKRPSKGLTAIDLYRFAGIGSLDIDLVHFRKNLEEVILPMEVMARLMDHGSF
ncbi:MAG: hypothetical protein A4E53_01173 [Pelotomaculum sp. PtaB.Bin104]|nr:MAG: hypothetical protein A4E53_01173 [Pelotomaculum sp. PtaB.Bin104]